MNWNPYLSRREALQKSALGFGGLALTQILETSAHASLAARRAHFDGPAKRVIFVFLAGGPSQADLFNPKPYISARHGMAIDSPVEGDGQLRVGVKEFLPMAPVRPIRPRGQSGMLLSDLLPNLANVADDLTLLQAMVTDNKAHAPATLQFHTGHLFESRPSMGAWLSYGLGSENERLPSFVTIHPIADGRVHGSGFLPAAHQGMPLRAPRSAEDIAIDHLVDPDSDERVQRRRLDFLDSLNQRLLERVTSDSHMEGVIQSFELAYQMQARTPDLVDLSQESPETRRLYGVDEGPTDVHGRALLLARRLSESGVRFVQVTIDGWDHHGDIQRNLPNSCVGADKPIAGLIHDLKRRGLLDETLVMISGEFGRTYWSQDISGTSPIHQHGREHQQESFCTLLAGAGLRPGLTYGETDDLGYRPVSGRVHLHDLHATLLHLMGVDHTKLTHTVRGRDYRLTDVYGRVVREILA